MRILLIEDNEKLAQGLMAVLAGNAYNIDWVASGEEALAAIAVENFDLVILDLTLPDMDGLAVLRNLRGQKHRTPVLILTARGDPDDRVRGLDLGADDYLVKPFNIDELEARIRALLRRAAGLANAQVSFGPLTMDLASNQLKDTNGPLELSAREFSLFRVLLMSNSRIMTKAQLVTSLSNFDEDLSENALEQSVSRLRKRLEPYRISIKVARGIGYYLQDDTPRPAG